MSTLQFLHKCFTPNNPHISWQYVSHSVYDVRRSTIKGKMLAGVYILQSTRAAFNQTMNKTCQLCLIKDEDMVHFLCKCPVLDSVRKPLLCSLFAAVPYTVNDHPSAWCPKLLTQFILDVSHPKIHDICPLVASYIPQIEQHARYMCFALHKARSMRLCDKQGGRRRRRGKV